MNKPIVICENSFQVVWAKAIYALKENQWSVWNLVAQIDSPELYNNEINELFVKFAERHGLIAPKHVANTIFPQRFLEDNISREKLYKKYWRFFRISQKKHPHRWGMYFERMINYATPEGNIDQLGRIIDNINKRKNNYGASYTIVIPCPHKESNKLMGAPCLNYITIQVEIVKKPIERKSINLLAVYRNHDFTVRTYGNYLGLCNLLKYIACETNSSIGSLTCISSHAYVPNNKAELIRIADRVLEVKY